VDSCGKAKSIQMITDHQTQRSRSSADFFSNAVGTQIQLAHATSLDQLETILGAECQLLGFDSFFYALRTPTSYSHAEIIVLDGFPERWVKRYFEHAYFDIDPVKEWCVKKVVPLCWSDLVLDPGSRSETMMLDAASYGLCDGVSMPVHSPQGELGILSFSINAPPAQARSIAKTSVPHVQLLANHLQQAVRRISGLLEEPGPELTERERECLSWAADGKTSGEIAQILSITERTVNFHLNNLAQKMGVTSRQHAVGRAAMRRLIQPRPF
jgi:DNA-binding CsgD family transcriptional regulator